MTNKEAIKYLQQLYPNGGHCWLDEQHIEAIGMAVKALQEVPVSEDLMDASNNYGVNVRKGYPRIKDETDRYICNAFEAGAKWQKKQFEKNRLKHCNSITNEQAELEQGFIDQHLDKHQRMPTFLDAIEYGMKLKEQQMMVKAIDARCFGFQGAALFSFRLPSDKYLVGSEVKVIVIKED